jgi:glycosyltransferase involved in cell wall biosynthesis
MKKYQSILQKASHTIYVTDHFLQSRYPTKGKAIGCSDVIVNDLNASILENRLVKIQNLADLIVLGTVAAVDVVYKGQADVIKAISILKSENILFRYRIVGQGNATRLKELIKDYDVADLVEIVGPVNQSQVFEFLDTIDVYIQPSKTEGLPRAVIESMSRACPAIGSNIAGIPELISKNALFGAGNIKEIVKLLKQLNKDTLEEWAKDNFRNAERFKKETLDAKRTEFYQQFKEDFNLE